MKTVRIMSYQGALEALSEPSLNQALYDDSAICMQGVLLTLDGQSHETRQSLTRSVLSPRRLALFQQQRFDALCRRIGESARPGEVFDLVEIAKNLMLDVACEMTGIDISSEVYAARPRLLRIIESFRRDATIVHSLGNISEIRTAAQQAFTEFKTLFLEPSIKARLGKTNAEEKDILGALLAARQRALIDDDTIASEIAFHMVCGLGAPENSLVNVLDQIFRYRRQHTDRAQKPLGLEFIRRMTEETLRLYPESPVSWRRTTDTVKLEGKLLQAGDFLIIDLVRANRDPNAYGEDAERFNHRRELQNGVLPWGLSFGAGVHRCPVRSFMVNTGNECGILVRAAVELLKHGVAPAANREPLLDSDTERRLWRSYPVTFTPS